MPRFIFLFKCYILNTLGVTTGRINRLHVAPTKENVQNGLRPFYLEISKSIVVFSRCNK